MTDAAAPGVGGGAEGPPRMWAEGADGVVLRGVECRSCGAVRLPYQVYGCDRCGATGEALRPAAPAAGRLRSFATVWRHPSRPVPFTLGEIQLDAGPVVVALLADGEAWTLDCPVESTALTPEEPRLLVFSRKEAS